MVDEEVGVGVVGRGGRVNAVGTPGTAGGGGRVSGAGVGVGVRPEAGVRAVIAC